MLRSLSRYSKIRSTLLFLFFLLLPALTIFYSAYYPNDSVNNLSAKDESLKVKSIDTQIVTKHWKEKDRERIKEQVKLLKELGVNYVAISTPYDHPEVIRTWAEELHNKGIFVWFRSHWLSWEGDEGRPKNMTSEEYLSKTKEFIIQNSSIFREGDSFTLCVEPEQAGVEEGVFKTWKEYNQFVRDQIDTSNQAFKEINMLGKVNTNWISLNGWVALRGLEEETVKKMGLITIDHHTVEDANLPPPVIAENFVRYIDHIYQKWQVPIMIGEWGYSINQEVSDFQQKQVIAEVLRRVESRPYIYGFNYWAHMGNSSRIINDRDGQNLSYRSAALVIRDFFNR